MTQSSFVVLKTTSSIICPIKKVPNPPALISVSFLGFMFSGISPDNQLPEIIELKNHPWFIGVQFHPEFKSRPLSPHPLFSSFIKAAKNHK